MYIFAHWEKGEAEHDMTDEADALTHTFANTKTCLYWHIRALLGNVQRGSHSGSASRY